MPALAAARGEKARLASLRDRVRKQTEDRPGVYRMITATGEVAYVGKSKRLRTRLLSYFRAVFPSDKSARVVREASEITWTYVPSEFAALLEELRLIKRLRPRMNIAQKRDARNHAFVSLTDGRAPRLTVVRPAGAAQRGGILYGPLVGATRLREALRELSDVLGLRDCTHDRRMAFDDQRDLLVLAPRTPGCLRHEIGTCLGPCIAAVSERLYRDRVRQARGFLEGGSEEPVETLRSQMKDASDQLQFERAGILRDRIARLEELRDQLDRLRFAVESLSFVYDVPGHDGDDRSYVIRRGVVRLEEPTPRGEDETRAFRARARASLGVGTTALTTIVPSREVDELLLVSSWFSLHPGELTRTSPVS
ncbi:MAG: UvrB/UvrC motif-containing protein [Gemmatimonadota bacterium]